MVDTVTVALGGSVSLGEFATALDRLTKVLQQLSADAGARIDWIIAALDYSSAIATVAGQPLGVASEPLVYRVVSEYGDATRRWPTAAPPVTRRGRCNSLERLLRSLVTESTRYGLRPLRGGRWFGTANFHPRHLDPRQRRTGERSWPGPDSPGSRSAPVHGLRPGPRSSRLVSSPGRSGGAHARRVGSSGGSRGPRIAGSNDERAAERPSGHRLRVFEDPDPHAWMRARGAVHAPGAPPSEDVVRQLRDA